MKNKEKERVHEICQNTGFLWPVFSRIIIEEIRENQYSHSGRKQNQEWKIKRKILFYIKEETPVQVISREFC